MNQFEQAQKLEMDERESILRRRREAAEKADKPSLSHCEDCGEEIPEKRQALRGVTRCVECQGDFEKQQRMYR
jgi:phage/conjugal plasmid C-4 type zinc finger TraR family protein